MDGWRDESEGKEIKLSISWMDDTAAAAAAVNQCSLACELVSAARTFPRVRRRPCEASDTLQPDTYPQTAKRLEFHPANNHHQ